MEVETGQPPGATAEVPPRPDYDPRWRSLPEREAAKAAELTAAGEPTSVTTIRRLRRRYREQGLWGLVDQRATEYGPGAVPMPSSSTFYRLVAVLSAGRHSDRPRPDGLGRDPRVADEHVSESIGRTVHRR